MAGVEYAPRHDWGIGTLSRYQAVEQIGEGTFGCVVVVVVSVFHGLALSRWLNRRTAYRLTLTTGPSLYPLPLFAGRCTAPGTW